MTRARDAARGPVVRALRLFVHPQRGAVLTEQPMRNGSLRWLGGDDGAWRDEGTVQTVRGPTGLERLAEGTRLPRGLVAGDPSRQAFGMGGPFLVYAPRQRRCRSCGEEFVFTAAEQKHWYETLGFFVDADAVECASCRRTRHRLEQRRRAWAEAHEAAEASPSAEAHLAAARAALALMKAGGRVAHAKAVMHCGRARRLGAGSKADALREQLVKQAEGA